MQSDILGLNSILIYLTSYLFYFHSYNSVMYVSPVANRTCFVEVNVSSLRTLRGFLSKT